MTYENFIKAVEGLAKKYEEMNPDMYLRVAGTSCGLVATHGTRAELRRQWINQMLTEYSEEYKGGSEVILCDKNRKIMVVCFVDFWGNYGHGISKCSPTDQFDEEVGLAVAFAHFRDYPIPDYV
jgi:hypothetical protein